MIKPNFHRTCLQGLRSTLMEEEKPLLGQNMQPKDKEMRCWKFHWDQDDPHWESLKATLSSTVRWRPALHKWAEIYSAIFLLAKSLRGSTLEQNMPKYKGIREIKWCFEIVYRKLSQQRVEVLVIQEKYGEWNQKQD